MVSSIDASEGDVSALLWEVPSFLPLSAPLPLLPPSGHSGGPLQGGGSRGRLGEGPSPAGADTGGGTDEDGHWALGSGSYFCALENWEQTHHTRAVSGEGREQKEEEKSKEGQRGKNERQLVALTLIFDF